MEIFFSTTANYINNIQIATSAPPPQAPKPTAGPGSSIDFSGANAPQKDKRYGGVDSLGKGNIL